MPVDVAPFAPLVPVLDDRSDDVAEDLEGAFRGADQSPGFLAHRDDVHLRLATLGDGDGLAAFGYLVDQGEALRLEGGGIDFPLHGDANSDVTI